MSSNNDSNQQIVVHLHPDLETVCDVQEENIPPPPSSLGGKRGVSESEVFYESAAPPLGPEEQQNLEPAMEDIELSIRQGYDDDEEFQAIVPYQIVADDEPEEEEQQPAIVPPPVVCDEKPAEEVVFVNEEATGTDEESGSEPSQFDKDQASQKDDEALPAAAAAAVATAASSTSSKEPEHTKKKDKGCRCACVPNGAFQILFAQFFLLVGLIMAAWAVSDCKFIEATAGYPDPYIPPYYDEPQYWYYSNSGQVGETNSMTTTTTTIPPPFPTETRRGFGFVFNETLAGGCFAYDDAHQRYWRSDEFLHYFDFLGSDWNLPRIFTGIGMAIGWLVWLASFWMYCVSCIKAVRWLTGTTVLLLVAGFQCASFAVMGSSFCHEDNPDANCEPARGFWMMLGAILCYLVTAVMFCTMKNYPGRNKKSRRGSRRVGV